MDFQRKGSSLPLLTEAQDDSQRQSSLDVESEGLLKTLLKLNSSFDSKHIRSLEHLNNSRYKLESRIEIEKRPRREQSHDEDH